MINDPKFDPCGTPVEILAVSEFGLGEPFIVLWYNKYANNLPLISHQMGTFSY